jgi:glycerol-3-phosphate acyltransferase PlsX
MRIILDGMGSDNHPDPEVLAAVEASKTFGDTVLLVGKEDLLKTRLAALDTTGADVQIVHADEVFSMSDKLTAGALKKANTSMAVCMKLLKEGQGDVMVTMGNTGGAMANALVQLRRIKGVKRPALTALFPVKNGKCVVVDIGANAECRPEYLVQFGRMGAEYAKIALKKPSPRVALLSNGEEAGKGNDLVKATYPLLDASGLNFIGNVEGKELFGGEADVVVMDGFTGNILLKSSEAVAKLLVDTLREELMGSLVTKIGAALARPAFGELRKMLDPSEVGAVPLLGVNGLVFVGHGRSDARAVVSAIRSAQVAVEGDLLSAIRSTLEAELASAKGSSA